MTSVKSNKKTVNIEDMTFEPNPFSFGEIFTMKSGNSKGDKFRILYNGVSTREFTFVAKDVHIKVIPKYSDQFKTWSYTSFFTAESSGSGRTLFHFMKALDDVVVSNDALIRNKYRFEFPPAEEDPDFEDHVKRPIFEIDETLNSKKKSKQTSTNKIQMTSLSYSEQKNGMGTTFMTQTKDVSALLGFKWTKSSSGRWYGAGDATAFQQYSGDEMSKKNPMLVATLRFVIDHYGKGTKHSSYRIYVNSVMISGIVSRTESVDQLLEEEGWLNEDTKEEDEHHEATFIETSEPPAQPAPIVEPPNVSRQERLSNLPVANPEFKPQVLKATSGRIPFPV